jgi:heat shock protein HtpX
MQQIFKTTILLALMTALFVAVGSIVGGRSGATTALFLAALMNFGMYWFSGSIVLKTQGAVPLDEKKYPNIVRIVRELTQADNLPMPNIYYVDSPVPNAFATGRNPKHAVVAVTAGILDILNDAELKAVLGHELGHVKNRDMLVSTIAATMAGAISWIAQMAYFVGGNDEDNPNPIAMLAMVLLAPLAATLIQLAVSRSREFLADEHGAQLDGTGTHLANALRKLENFKQHAPPIQPTPAEQAQAHLMFANMFTLGGFAGLFSTHPSTEARIARLTAYTRRHPGGPILERK